MKKCTVIIMLLCILLCTACNKATGFSKAPPAFNELGNNYSFGSYAQLWEALETPGSDANKELISHAEEYNLSKEYKSLLNKFSENEIELYIPTISNVPLEMKEETGGITLFTSELFNLPWIWYRGEYNGGSVVVCITYTAIMENVENCQTYLEVQNVIAPSAPNPDNFSDKNYVKVEEIEKSFNGTTQTALFKQATSGRTYYGFLHNGMMISIWSHSPETLDETFWQKFYLMPYSATIE